MLFHFGSFTLDSLQRRISYLDSPIHLNPKVFDTLLYLATHPGRIVTKAELWDVVWQRAAVSEANLTQTIFLLRNALRTHDPRPHILTVPGRGYQFAIRVIKSPARCTAMLQGLDEDPRAWPEPGRHASRVHGWLSNRTAQSLHRAIHWCEQKIKASPYDAPAFVDLANAHCLLMSLGEIAPKQAQPKIQNAVIRALEGNPSAYSAFAPLGFLRCHFDRDWLAAERDFQRALDGCPNDLMAHHWYGEFLAAWQRFDESLLVLGRAQRKHPRSLLIQTDIAMTLFWAREYKSCEARLLKARSLDATFPRTNIILGSTYRQQARHAESIQTLEHITSARLNVIGLTMLGESHGAVGHSSGVNSVWRALQSLTTTRYVSAYAKALTCKNLGDTGRLFEFLETAEKENDYWLIWQRVSPHFDAFRREPRFRRLLHKTRLASSDMSERKSLAAG